MMSATLFTPYQYHLPRFRFSRLKLDAAMYHHMLFLVHLSFLSAGQAIGIPRISLDNASGRERPDRSALEATLLPLAVSRGFRTPLPFDEDVFDPTYVVSNTPS